jgi:hypothetical protein
VDVVPAGRAAASPQSIPNTQPALSPADHTLAGAALDAAQLLDVDVDQLAGALAFVATGRLEAQPAELAHPDAGQDARHG